MAAHDSIRPQALPGAWHRASRCADRGCSNGGGGEGPHSVGEDWSGAPPDGAAAAAGNLLPVKILIIVI